MNDPTVELSRETATITVRRPRGKVSKEDKKRFRDALADFNEYISDLHGDSSRLFIYINRERLDQLRPADRESTLVGLEQKVETAAQDIFSDQHGR